MEDIKLGWSTPALTEDKLSDGSKVYGVFVSGDKDIRYHCVDEQSAINLVKVLERSVVDIDIF